MESDCRRPVGRESNRKCGSPDGASRRVWAWGGPGWSAMCCKCDGAASKRSAPNDVDRELDRLTHSFEETLAELEQSAKRIESEFDSALAGIFRAHGDDACGICSLRASSSENFANVARDGRSGRSPRASAAGIKSSRRWRTRRFRQRADDVLDLGTQHHSATPRRSGCRSPSDSRSKRAGRRTIAAVGRRAAAEAQCAGDRRRIAWGKVRTRHCWHVKREFPRSRRFPEFFRWSPAGRELLVDGYRGTLVIAPTTTSTETNFESGWRSGGPRSCAAKRLPRAGPNARRPIDRGRSQYRHSG